MKQIASALVKAQREFGPALKTSTNPHFRSKYADLAACVEAVIDALNNNGIYLMQMTHETPDGAMAETVFVHESGEMLSAGKLFFPASKHDAQLLSRAVSHFMPPRSWTIRHCVHPMSDGLSLKHGPS